MKIQRLHHFAWKCRDAEETRKFYEDLLDLPLEHIIRAENVPSTGEHCPYVHLFFEMAVGSCIAFFDLGDDETSEPSSNTPSWVNFLALEVDTEADLLQSKRKLEVAGVVVLGVTDHGFVKSIYFHDPNGIRLELTTRISESDEMAKKKAGARTALNRWNEEKAIAS